jgi:ABC-2 type transport system permease protein
MIAVEVVKLLRRPRTWVSVALLCALPAMVAVFLAVTEVGPAPGQEPAFLSAVLANGALLPAAALALVVPVFLPVAVAVVAGDAIAGEAAAGTLRYLLIRPVSRTRLLIAKLLATVLFMLIAVAAVALSAYALGSTLFPAEPGAVTSVSGVTLTRTELLLRLAATVLYVGFSMLGVGAVALFLSTVTDSSLGATLGALAALVASQVLVTLDAASAVRPYLPTRYWFAWIDFFRDPILWRDIERGLAIQGIYVLVFLGMAWANFATRDITT